MSEHGMITRLRKKVDLGLVDPLEPVKSKQPAKKKVRAPVRLTEDLLYIVNKKLCSKDKARREKILQDVWEDARPFTKVINRRKTPKYLNQTELAVMHRVNFNSSYTAVCEISSMETFVESIYQAGLLTNSREYKRLLGSMPTVWRCSFGHQYYDDEVDVRDVVGFVQLPNDYFRPHSDCCFFGELAWKENGVIMVEAAKLSLCLDIWLLKKWLILPDTSPRPSRCIPIVGQVRCNSLLHAIWTDDRLRKFFENQGIVEITANYRGYSDTWIMTEDRDDQTYRESLQRAHDEMKNYCKKLITGEEMISRSNRAINVLSSVQLQKVLGKLNIIISCFEHL